MIRQDPDFAKSVTLEQLRGTDRSNKEIIEELTKLYDLIITDKKIRLHGILEYDKEKKTITTFKPVDVELLQKFLKII